MERLKGSVVVDVWTRVPWSCRYEQCSVGRWKHCGSSFLHAVLLRINKCKFDKELIIKKKLFTHIVVFDGASAFNVLNHFSTLK